MRALMFLSVLGLVTAACTSDPGSPIPQTEVTPVAIEVPAERDCSDVIEVPEAGDTTHVTDPTEFNHNTDPPTSGRHFGEWITPTGVYTEPLADGNTVHNLEHGHVFVQHDGVTDAEREAIIAPVRGDPHMTLAAPRPGMGYQLAITSWARIQVCDEIPDDVTAIIVDFITQNRDSGVAPESVG